MFPASIEKKTRWSLVLFFSVDLFVLFFGNLSYGTKDDVRIMQLVSGTMLTDSPSAYIMYPNILVGHLLKSLYEWLAWVPWYLLLLFFCLVFAHLAFVYTAARFGGVCKSIVLGALFYLFFFELTFTETSILLAFAGTLLLYSGMVKNGLGARGVYLLYIFSFTALVLSVLIRPETFFYALVFGFVFFFFALPFREVLKKIVPIFLLVALTGAALHAYDIRQYKNSQGDAEFADYNRYKSFIIDFQVGEHATNLNEALAKTGWSHNDYDVFYHWLFLKNERFSLQKIKGFVEALHWEFGSKWDDVVMFYRNLANDPFVSIFSGVMLTCLFFCAFGVGKRRGAVFFLISASVLFAAVTVMTKMPPPRLYLPTIFFLMAGVILFSENGGASRAMRLVGVAAVVLLVVVLIEQGSLHRQMREKHAKYVAELRPDRFYLSVDDALVPMGVDPKSDLASEKFLSVVPFGTVVILASVQGFMARHAFTDYKDLLKENVYLLVPKKSLWKCALLKTYIREHDAIVCEYRVDEEVDGLMVVKFIE